jgi:hypothetical protein
LGTDNKAMRSDSPVPYINLCKNSKTGRMLKSSTLVLPFSHIPPEAGKRDKERDRDEREMREMRER